MDINIIDYKPLESLNNFFNTSVQSFNIQPEELKGDTREEYEKTEVTIKTEPLSPTCCIKQEINDEQNDFGELNLTLQEKDESETKDWFQKIKVKEEFDDETLSQATCLHTASFQSYLNCSLPKEEETGTYTSGIACRKYTFGNDEDGFKSAEKLETYLCSHCGFSTYLKSILRRHINALHILKMKVLHCPYCHLRYDKKSKLRLHIVAAHRGSEVYQCNLCTYTTNRENDLEIHIESVHRRLRSFSCTYCDYKAIRKSCLNLHINSVHLKLRAFPCPYCHYRASHSSTLKKHVDAKHKKLKNFSCPYCTYRSCRKSTLRKHIRRKH